MSAREDFASVPALAVFLLFVFLAYRAIVHPLVVSPLSRIPNAHWSVPLSSFWILRFRWLRRENTTLHAAHAKLGPVVRVGPNEISVGDLDGVRTVYQGGFEKPEWYSVFDSFGVPCMFSSRGSREHAARKRMISQVYSKSYVQSSEQFLAQAKAIVHERLLPVLVASTHDSQIPHGIDIYSLLMAVTMDFVTAYAFGLDKGTNFIVNKAFRDHFAELYRQRSRNAFFDHELPRLTAWCRKLKVPLCPWSADYANQEMADWFLRLCENSETCELKWEGASAADKPTVRTALLAGLEKERQMNGPNSVLLTTALARPQLSICSELFDHVLAGQETSGLTLSYLCWRLSQKPALQAELRVELRSLQPPLTLLQPASLPDLKALDTLPLLQSVLMETLRLHAPIPGAQPRQTPAEGCRLGCYAVPGGVRVAATAYTLHRNVTVFPDPEVWDHTRWLASHQGPGEHRARTRQFWAFGSGGRMCIGSNFAMQEMKLVVAAIYTNFTTHIVDDEGMAHATDGYTGRPAKEQFHIRLEKVD